MRRLLAALPESLRAARSVFRNRDLATLELSWAGSMSGEYLSVVALGVYAYETGGATAVGAIGAIQLAPAALLSSFAGVLGDRVRRELVVLASQLVAAVAMAGAAVAAFTSAPDWTVYVLAALLAVANQAFYPAQTALIPLFAKTASEVTAASATSALIRSAAGLAAPAVGGVVLLAGSTDWLFAISAGLFTVAALLATGLARTDAVRVALPAGTLLRELFAGFRAAREDPHVATVLRIFAAHSFGRGALGVLVVVVALQLLELGDASVGFFTAAVGMGGLIGGIATAAVAGRRRLAGHVAAGLFLTGVPLVLAAPALWTAWVVASLVGVGIGITTVSSAGTVLLVRSTRDDVLARVIGVLGSLRAGAMALGSFAAPLLIHLVGVRWTLVAVGLVTPLAAVATRAGLRRIDDASSVPEHELRLLRASPVFAPILPVALERLAAKLEPAKVAAGTRIVREGETGERVFLVAEGELEISSGGRRLATCGEGELFGEMSLLRNQPRNATVTALVDSTVYALERDEFLAAVIGHPGSSRLAHDLVTSRLQARGITEGR